MTAAPSPTDDVQVLRLGGGQILLRGPAVLVVSRLAALGAKHWYSVDGGSVSAPVRQLLASLAGEAAEHVRDRVRADAPAPRVLASSTPMRQTPWQSSAQVAVTLGCSERHVRRIASTLGGRRVGARWEFDPHVVASYALEPEGTPS